MIAIAAYTPEWHVRPGERVGVHIATALPIYHARLVRLLGSVASGDDWATQTELCEAGLAGPRQGQSFPLRLGSWMVADCRRASASPYELALIARVAPQPASATMAELRHEGGIVRIDLSSDGRLQLVEVDGSGQERAHSSDSVLPPHEWLRIALRVEAGQSRATLVAAPLADGEGEAITAVIVDLSIAVGVLLRVIFAGRSYFYGVVGCFDGKLEAPTLSELSDGSWQVEAQWDLACLPYDDARIPDVNGRHAPIRLVNGPARGVTSSAWNGQAADYQDAPELYAAAAFHRDDLDDAEWPEAFSFHIPVGARSGAYALILSKNEAPAWHDATSFWVLPSLFYRAARQVPVLPCSCRRSAIEPTPTVPPSTMPIRPSSKCGARRFPSPSTIMSGRSA